MYDVDGKLLSGMKSMYVDSSACVRVKQGESEWFRIDSGVRYGEGGEDGDRMGESEIPGGQERVKITWPLVCR